MEKVPHFITPPPFNRAVRVIHDPIARHPRRVVGHGRHRHRRAGPEPFAPVRALVRAGQAAGEARCAHHNVSGARRGACAPGQAAVEGPCPDHHVPGARGSLSPLFPPKAKSQIIESFHTKGNLALFFTF